MAQFFEWINRLLGVKTPGELVFHPVFIGLCVALFVFGLIKGWKALYLPIITLLGGAAIFHYFYPEDPSRLEELVKFLALTGVLALVVIYFGFIRE
jgi:hypothetical protein